MLFSVPVGDGEIKVSGHSGIADHLYSFVTFFFTCSREGGISDRSEAGVLTSAHLSFRHQRTYSWLQMPAPAVPPYRRRPDVRSRFLYGFVLILVVLQFWYSNHTLTIAHASSPVPIHAENTIARCRALDTIPGPPSHFHSRTSSDRYVPGTSATLILNARIWTGGRNGTEILEGHVYFDKGIFKSVGGLDVNAVKMLHGRDPLDIVDAKGAWMTPG